VCIYGGTQRGRSGNPRKGVAELGAEKAQSGEHRKVRKLEWTKLGATDAERWTALR
jgi:hypothetical protein